MIYVSYLLVMANQVRRSQTLPRHEIRLTPIRKRASSKDIFINALGVFEEMPPSIIHRPLGTGDYLLMAFHRSAMIEMAGTMIDVDADHLVVWDPAAAHRYGRADAVWSHSWLHCSGSFVTDQLALAGIIPGQPIACSATTFAERVRDIYREISAHEPSDAAIIRAHLGLIFRHAARVVHGERIGAAIPPELLVVRRHLEEHLAKPLRLPALARLAGWSVPHFCAQFRRHFSISAIDLLIDLRMHQARLLLTDRNLTVEEVARRVGYADYRQFSKLFRKRFGHAPRVPRA